MDLDNYQWNQTEIRGWAYETEPGKPILAGSVPEPSTLLIVGATLSSCLVSAVGKSHRTPSRSHGTLSLRNHHRNAVAPGCDSL